MVIKKWNLQVVGTLICMLNSTVRCESYGTARSTNLTFRNYFNALTPTYYPPNGECTDFYVPVSIDYEGQDFNGTKWQKPFELQDALINITASARKGNLFPLGAKKSFKGSYQIAASFCTPRRPNGKEKTVIVATHGIGPGRAHWNSPYKPEEYNFVHHALDCGYSVFFYDRLGCGASSRINGFEAQLNTAKAVLQQLATLIRAGKYTGKIKASKIAVMGFSFGSYTTHAAIADTPSIADAVILTGFSMNTSATAINGNGLLRSFVPRIAREENPALYGALDTGYVTWPSVYDLVMNYFKAPAFEEDVATFTESAKQPYTLGEFLTFAGPAGISAEKWDKPALHLTGELDYIVCDGYCPGVFESPARELYKNAKPLQLSLVKGASHHINFHKNATGAFGVITKFLEDNRL